MIKETVYCPEVFPNSQILKESLNHNKKSGKQQQEIQRHTVRNNKVF